MATFEEICHVRIAYDLFFINPGESRGIDWRHAMAANWDTFQGVKNGRVEWPKGPIANLPLGNFVPRWVDAWVVQGGGMGAGTFLAGPSQSTSHSSSWSGWGTAPYDRWEADVAGWVNGNFEVGEPAMGISVLALRDRATGANIYEWWFDVVVLVPWDDPRLEE